MLLIKKILPKLIIINIESIILMMIMIMIIMMMENEQKKRKTLTSVKRIHRE
mgnify:CR=1 FL=1